MQCNISHITVNIQKALCICYNVISANFEGKEEIVSFTSLEDTISYSFQSIFGHPNMLTCRAVNCEKLSPIWTTILWAQTVTYSKTSISASFPFACFFPLIDFCLLFFKMVFVGTAATRKYSLGCHLCLKSRHLHTCSVLSKQKYQLKLRRHENSNFPISNDSP